MTIIIDSKSLKSDKRISVSIEDTLFLLFKISDWRARSLIRDAIKHGEIVNSSDARLFILKLIVKPSILTAYNKKHEIQLDIEDF
jgi:hypothetical protein